MRKNTSQLRTRLIFTQDSIQSDLIVAASGATPLERLERIQF